MSTQTANMGLLIPAANDTDYPTSISDSFTDIDTHDHSSGKGVPVVTGGIADLAVTTAKINALAVTTAKLADASVTPAKRAALGEQISSSCGAFTGSGTPFSEEAVTNLSLSITTTGRRVFIGLQPDNTTNVSAIALSNAGMAVEFRIYVDGTAVYRGGVGTGLNLKPILPGSIWTLAALSAGSHTVALKFEVTVGTGANVVIVNYAQLIAYEL